MKKKILLLIGIIGLLLPLKVNGISSPVWVGDEPLDSEVTTNASKTAVYNPEDDSLTLTNYNGGPIYYEETSDLTLILVGENIITSDGSENGLTSWEANVKVQGTGSLLIVNPDCGIYLEKGSLTIADAAVKIENSESNGILLEKGDFLLSKGELSIKNVLYNGILTREGSVTINGTLLMDDDLAIKEEKYGMPFYYQAINADGGNIIIDGDVTINNAGKGFICESDIKLESGKINIKAFDKGIHTAEEFALNGADVNIEILSSDSQMLKYGILSEKSIALNKGVLRLTVPENNVPIAAVNYLDNDLSFVISGDVDFPLGDYSIQDAKIDGVYDIKALGKEGFSIEFDEELGHYIITNGVEVINPETLDNFYNYLLYGIVSFIGMLGCLKFLSKKANN